MRDISKIATLSPVNKTAGVVTGKGEPRHERVFNPVSYRSTSPSMRVIPFTGLREHDFTGRRVGRFRVVGYCGRTKQRHNKRGRWLVKCDCGAYELRTAHALNNPDATQMCAGCEYTEKLKKGVEKTRGDKKMSYSDTAHDRYFEQMENEHMTMFYTQDEIDAERAEREKEEAEGEE